MDKIWLFRMVHHTNIEYILTHGLYTHHSPKADSEYVNIGDKKLIGEREDYEVKIKQGGNLGNYIPFYFAGHSPMLLNIKTGHRGITKRPQENIVYIVCELNDIVEKCERWVFTDGHAKDKITRFFDNLEDLNQLDWNAIKAQYWYDTEEKFDRMRRKQAEFMVFNHVPISCVKGLIVKNEAKKREMEQIIHVLRLPLKIHVDTQCKYYYP